MEKLESNEICANCGKIRLDLAPSSCPGFVGSGRYKEFDPAKVNFEPEIYAKKLEKALDLINHPPHYKSHPSGIECIQITEHMGFCLGNVIKYVWRAGEKENTTRLEDLKKAKWYLEREIERLTR